MSFFSILLLALALAMDATAVAATRGMSAQRVTWSHAISVAIFFGGSQAAMPLLGYWLGHALGPLLHAWDAWVAFVLLVGIGGKMLWEALKKEPAESDETPKKEQDPFALRVMFALAIATSIDAFAAGITLPLLGAPLVLSLVTIGVTTAALSVLGLFAGKRLGEVLGKRLDILGGVVLVALGVKALAFRLFHL